MKIDQSRTLRDLDDENEKKSYNPVHFRISTMKIEIDQPRTFRDLDDENKGDGGLKCSARGW